MEVAERQAREKEKLDETNGSMDDEEEYDLNRIISGMATLSGPCGTYAVKEPQGLALLSDTEEELGTPAHCDNEPWVKEQRGEGEASGAEEQGPPQLAVSASEDSIEVKHPSLLERGQTVQVVTFENGVAKLARGSGHIIANSSQLVKSKLICA